MGSTSAHFNLRCASLVRQTHYYDHLLLIPPLSVLRGGFLSGTVLYLHHEASANSVCVCVCVCACVRECVSACVLSSKGHVSNYCTLIVYINEPLFNVATNYYFIFTVMYLFAETIVLHWSFCLPNADMQKESILILQ